MAIEKNVADQFRAIGDEHLATAKTCIDARPQRGYSAALLLLSVIDAIGHAKNVGRGNTRLAVLNDPVFGQHLGAKQLQQLAQWYRHLLAHKSLMAERSYLAPGPGAPFEIAPNGELALIRVEPLYDLVKKAWGSLGGAVPDPGRAPLPAPIGGLPAHSLTPISSGRT